MNSWVCHDDLVQHLRDAGRGSLPAAAATAPRVFHADLEKAAPFERFAIQRGLRGACLMPFHFHEAEAFALAGEDVMGEVQGTHGAELGK